MVMVIVVPPDRPKDDPAPPFPTTPQDFTGCATFCSNHATAALYAA
jgi:hypothetical protein